MKKRIIPVLLALALLLGLIPVGVAFADATTDEEILQQRRDKVFDEMWKMATVMWRATEDFTYTFAGSTVNIQKGRLYRGIPYTHARGTYAAFMECLEEPNEKGEYNAVGLTPEALSGGSLTARVGNDCSGATNTAYGSISPTIKQAGASTQVPANGFPRVALDKYVVKPSDTTNSDCDTVCANNGEQVMYSIYAEVRKADLWVNNGHAMMNHYVEVVYNEDGTINGEKSKAIVVHQTPTYIRATDRSAYYTSGEFSEENYGEKVYKTYGVDETRTFAWLYDAGYMPVTCKELIDASAVEKSTVSDSVTDHSFETLLSGTLSSNYQIDTVTMTITDENGVQLQKGTARCYRTNGDGTNADMVYDLSQLRYENPEKMIGMINPNLLGVGNYRCRVDVRLFNGEIKEKVRDFDFTVEEDDLCEGWIDNSDISAQFVPGTTKAVCPYCGGDAVEWTALPAPVAGSYTELIAGEHYYVAQDMNIQGYYQITDDSEIKPTCVHLNGHNIVSSTTVFQMKIRGRLHAMGNGKVIGGGTSNGATIDFQSSNAEIYLHGGTYGHLASTTRPTIYTAVGAYAQATTYLYGGATLCRMNGALGPNIDIGNGHFYMKGGLITDGWNPDGKGGNVVIQNTKQTTTFTMDGGIIAGGMAKYGGNVYVTNAAGNFAMNDGEVYLGIAGYPSNNGAGGNIYVENKGNVKITDGLVDYGKAYKNGGNIYATGGAQVAVGGLVEKGNGNYGGASEAWGGNVYLSSDDGLTTQTAITVTGTVRNPLGKYSNGANIGAATGSVKIVVDGGTVSGGAVTSRGGNVYMIGTAPSITVKNNGSISGGSAINGGNIATNSAKATITVESGGSITGGTASSYGGNIRLHAEATVEVSDGTVDGNIYAYIGTVNLSGTAAVGDVEFGNDLGKLQVANGWSGSASVKWSQAYAYGETISARRGICAAEGYTGTLVYDGLETKPNIFGVDGAFVIAGTQVVGQTTKWVVDNAAAVAAVQNGEYIKLFTDNALVMTKDAYVDINGHNVSASGAGTLYGMDSANDDFDPADSGKVTAACPVADCAQWDERYVAIDTNGAYSFHRFDIGLYAVVLRPDAAGVYYQAQYECDPVLAQRIGYRGVAMSVASMPTQDFTNEDHVLYTKLTGAPVFADGYALENSCILNNVLMADTVDDNDENGKMPIYARPYAAIDKDGDGQVDYTVVADEDQSGDYSLLDILTLVNDNWVAYETRHELLRETYAKWKTWGINWDDALPNFAA